MRAPTLEEYQRIIDVAVAGPTFEDASEAVLDLERALGICLDEDQWCAIRDIVHQKPLRD